MPRALRSSSTWFTTTPVKATSLGPRSRFKGVCNTTYYLSVPRKNPRYYMDYTGTGNTLNVRHPQVLEDVDGFISATG